MKEFLFKFLSLIKILQFYQSESEWKVEENDTQRNSAEDKIIGLLMDTRFASGIFIPFPQTPGLIFLNGKNLNFFFRFLFPIVSI